MHEAGQEIAEVVQVDGQGCAQAVWLESGVTSLREEVRARPFVKWAGGKTQLLSELREAVPAAWDPARDYYYEPFVGGGALYFHLGPRRAVLCDACPALMNAWWAVAWSPDQLIGCLSTIESQYRRDPERTYYRERGRSLVPGLGEPTDVEAAARFIFLNKTCYNGLYRVNSRGEYNVSWCKDGGVTVCDDVNLRACADFMRGRELRLCCESFDEHLRQVLQYEGDHLRGALVYLDPPYVPRSRTAHFTRYTRDGFDGALHRELVVLAEKLRDRGAHVVVSQALDELLVAEYQVRKFSVRRVKAKRKISCDGEGRGDVSECIITGTTP